MATSIDQELERLFDWNPPALLLSPDASKSKSKSKHSRGPAFYDKHLSKKLILLKVNSLSSLRRDIAGVVDRTLSSIQERGIVLPQKQNYDLFPLAGHRKMMDYVRNQPMENEMSLANFYRGTTATYCLPVASTLALHPSAPLWDCMLQWDNSDYAIAGGVLRILPSLCPALLGDKPPDIQKDLLTSLSESRAKEVAEVVKRLPDIMTWVIKSFSVAPEGVMTALGDTAGDPPFKWDFCHNVHCGHNNVTSFGLHTPVVDAVVTPWKIPSVASLGGPEAPGTIQTCRTLRRSDRIRMAALQQRRLPSGQALHQESCQESNSIPKSTTKQVKGKKKRVEDDDSYKEDDKAHEIRTAHNYLQQAWAQAVRTDSTLICLHAGSFEYIGVRHRATQQLFLSDLIHTSTCSDPGYGKLHVGLYIAALEDAIDRARQLDENDVTDEGPGPATYRSSGGDPDARGSEPKGGSRGGGRSGGGKQSKRQKGKERAHDRILIFHETSLRNIALIYLQYGIYDSPMPASFIRETASALSVGTGPTLPPSTPPYGNRRHFQPEEYMSIVLTSEIAEGATGMVHGATLEVQTSDGKVLTDNVVVKLALLEEQKDRLRNEYVIYQKLTLNHVKGIPTVLGLFNDIEEGPSLLIMMHAGTNLCRGQSVTSSQRAAFLAILRGIHKAEVLHCDLRPQNLLINELGDAAIIDFDQSERDPSKKAMNRECAALARILDGVSVL